MALAKSSEARAESGEEIFEYLAMTFHVSELSPLRYFRIFIGEHSWPASESSWTLFGDRVIEIVERLGLPTNYIENFRIRIANK